MKTGYDPVGSYVTKCELGDFRITRSDFFNALVYRHVVYRRDIDVYTNSMPCRRRHRHQIVRARRINSAHTNGVRTLYWYLDELTRYL